jgi:hypothetical protein
MYLVAKHPNIRVECCYKIVIPLADKIPRSPCKLKLALKHLSRQLLGDTK